QATANQGVSTNLNPLKVSVALGPQPIDFRDGTLLTNHASLTATGTTEPGSTVTLETGSDGQFNDGTTTADSRGQYSQPVSLTAGLNNVQVRSTDRFGQQAVSSVQINLDDHGPTIVVTSPPSGTVTNTGITIIGTASDDLSGLASLSVELEHGWPILIKN